MNHYTVDYKPNFQTKTGEFIPGYYSFESGIGYRFIYKNTLANINKINNSYFMLELFNELPADATINNI